MRRTTLVLACAAATYVVVASPAYALDYRSKTRRVASGVRLISMVDRAGVHRVKVVAVDPSGPASVDVALSNGMLPGLEPTSSMARRRGALAAINGDYARPNGRPVYTFARNGWLVQSTPKWGQSYAFDEGAGVSHLGHRSVSVSAVAPASGISLGIARFNRGDPRMGEIAAYTRVGGDAFRPPRFACAVRLRPLGPPARGADGDHDIPTVVEARACSARRMEVEGGIVLATPLWGPRAALVNSLREGEAVMLRWSLRGWPAVLDVIGGNPVLVYDGEIVVGRSSVSFYGRHPRTGVGVTADGRILLVTVDGRRPGYSVGMTPLGFARLFRSLGARWALNLDGGGSTTMYVQGEVVNRPSDGRERPVSSALVVVPDSAASAAASTAPAPSVQTTAMVTDPASTGGLADMLAREGRLPGFLEPAARGFAAHVSR